MGEWVMIRRWIFPLLVMLLFGTAAAQNDGGQFWVRMYEDRNGNGVRDAGEPLLTSGAAVSLINSQAVVIASALLDESPNSAQGLIGFQYLVPGEYTVVVTSAEYDATTETSFTRIIESDATPTVVEFGGQQFELTSSATSSTPRGLFGLPIYLGEPSQVARVALSLLGALVVAGAMTVLGLFVYSLIIRKRQRAERKTLREQPYTP
jgi:hypothetical protein